MKGIRLCVYVKRKSKMKGIGFIFADMRVFMNEFSIFFFCTTVRNLKRKDQRIDCVWPIMYV